MIKEFVERFENGKSTLEASFATKAPEDYESIVRDLVKLFHDMDPERIVKIDHGDYQGTLMFIIGEIGYQPSRYWYVLIGYGTCTTCDTLEFIKGDDAGPTTPEQVKDYMTLALHIVQGLKEIDSDEIV